MLQHAPNINISFLGATGYSTIPASTANLTFTTASAVNNGELILWYFATNTATATVNVSHTGLSATGGTSIQPTGGVCMHGWLAVRYPNGLASSTVVTFNKPSFWGTNAVVGGFRVTNAQRVRNYGFSTTNIVANTAFGFNMTQSAGTVNSNTYWKSQATLALIVAAGNTSLTGIDLGSGYNPLINNVTNPLSVSAQWNKWNPVKPGNELILWQFNNTVNASGILILRLSN